MSSRRASAPDRSAASAQDEARALHEAMTGPEPPGAAVDQPGPDPAHQTRENEQARKDAVVRAIGSRMRLTGLTLSREAIGSLFDLKGKRIDPYLNRAVALGEIEQVDDGYRAKVSGLVRGR